MGWEAAETVAHEYDVDGVLVASRVTREPEWDPWQRSLALAGFDLDNDVDPRHGHQRSESTNPTAGDDDGDYRYVADEPVVDYAARAQARAEKAWREEHKGDDTAGLIFPVRKLLARDP